MKLSIIYVSIISLVVLNFNGAAADEKTTVIELSGNFGCRRCTKIITTALRKVYGVKNIEMSADYYNVTVTYDGDMTEVKALERALIKAGFDANGKEGDIMAWQLLPRCCRR